MRTAPPRPPRGGFDDDDDDGDDRQEAAFSANNRHDEDEYDAAQDTKLARQTGRLGMGHTGMFAFAGLFADDTWGLMGDSSDDEERRLDNDLPVWGGTAGATERDDEAGAGARASDGGSDAGGEDDGAGRGGDSEDGLGTGRSSRWADDAEREDAAGAAASLAGSAGKAWAGARRGRGTRPG